MSLEEPRTHVILSEVATLRVNGRRGRGTVYYYLGNFFWPMTLDGSETGRVTRAIRQFQKDNKAMIAADRARPDYLTIEQLCDLEPEKVQ